MTASTDLPATDALQPFCKIQEPLLVALLCILASARVFVFAAAFPFFGIVDEQEHFDLVFRYAHGDIPTGLVYFHAGAARLIILNGTVEYFHAPTEFRFGKIPAPRRKAISDRDAAALEDAVELVKRRVNHESTQPPLYYMLAGGWYRIGEFLGISGLSLLYWIRFLNVPIYGLIVCLAYLFLKSFYSTKPFLRIGVPLLLVVFPQDTFYSINNDVLAALVCGAAFYCLLRVCLMKSTGWGFHALTGSLVAAAVLTKLNNLPLLATLLVFVVVAAHRALRDREWRDRWSKLVVLTVSAVVPVGAWMIRNRLLSGDVFGTAQKMQVLGWSLKPVGQMWHHPIFTFGGLWLFSSGLLTKLWRGEFVWHAAGMDSSVMDQIYFISSFVFLAVAAAGLALKRQQEPGSERFVNGMSFLTLAVFVIYLAGISVAFDFGTCFYPSRARPFLTSGRLLAGLLVSLLVLDLQGFSEVLHKLGVGRLRAQFMCGLAFAVMILAAEIWLSRDVFASQCNWNHLL